MPRLLLLVSRTTTVVAAGTFCYVLIKISPSLAAMWSTILFGPHYQQSPPWLSSTLFFLFTFFVLTVCFPFLNTLGWALLADTRKKSRSSLPFISIVIPAYNEEGAILRSLEALKQIEYPAFEVIIINDGSTDFTFSAIEQAQVQCIHLRKNKGKAAALNAGIARARGNVIVFSDSDSWLHPMALRHLVQGFSSPDIGAVSGSVEIDPRNNLLEQWQTIEYTFGQFLVKNAQIGSCSSVAICPGPICAFRKDVLLQIGGFSNRTITEDFDATLAIIDLGYRVNYTPKAIAYTEAPTTWKALKHQRLRWFRGHIQTFRLHKNLLFSPKTGLLGLYWLPIYYLFLGYACSILELFLIPLLPCLIFASNNAVVMLQTTSFYVLMAFLFVSTGYSSILFGAKKLNISLMLAAFVIYPYLFYLSWLRICAIVNEIRGKLATWSG